MDALDTRTGTNWIGHPSFLIPLDDAMSYERDAGQRPTFKRSAGGGQRAYIPSTRPPRTWSVGIENASPRHYSALNALVESTLPPWAWIDAWATVTNVMTPGASMLIGATTGATQPNPTRGGVVYAADGSIFPSCAVLSGPATLASKPVPVIGRKVSCSVYAAAFTGGTAVLNLMWRDYAGATISTTSGGSPRRTTAETGYPARLSYEGITPPAGAASVVLLIGGAQTATAAAVTWTDTLEDWHIGGGADQVVISDGPKEGVIMAVPGTQGRMMRADVAFTVSEVGPASW